MAVLPRAQGTGLADQLIKGIEAELFAAGCSFVTLDTTAPLVRAIRFYERHGYVRSGTVPDFFGMPLYELRKEPVARPTTAHQKQMKRASNRHWRRVRCVY
jgi:ribosomal protein S18 acetylase RimI-like enzyme